MISTIEKTVRVKHSNIDTILVIKKLYDLRKELEANYSGKLRSKKYEQTREFTIALNHAIFTANQVLSEKPILFDEMVDLEKCLQGLQKDFKELSS
jgi:hypothetical protein